MKKIIGIPPHFYCEPLIHALRPSEVFELRTDAPVKNAIKLREHLLHGVLLTPLDYARDSSEYAIVPDISLSSSRASESIVLHFRSGVRNITTLVADPSSNAEIVLATIILSEQFDLVPTIVPATGSLEAILQLGDAALLVGDAALRESVTHRDTIDLVEEWNELTDLPYVHNLWCFRYAELTATEAELLVGARDKGVAGLWEIALESQESLERTAKELHEYLSGFSYGFDDDVRESLSEFFHYAYYHGVIPDIPEFNFFRDEAAGEDPSPSVSLN
jgi:chorismate dehydratase